MAAKTQSGGVKMAPPELAVLACGVVVICLWSVAHEAQLQLPSYYSVLVVGGFGLVMASAVAVVAAATVVAWITVMVLLVLVRKPRRRWLAEEGRKISKEIMVGFLVKVLLKEGNVFAALCSVFGYPAMAWAWSPLMATQKL